MQIYPALNSGIFVYKERNEVKRIKGSAQSWEEVSTKPEYAAFLAKKKQSALNRINALKNQAKKEGVNETLLELPAEE